MPHPLAPSVRRAGLILALACAALSACGPLIVGSGAALIADQVAEDQRGGDGLF
jgi:hypothetical protein